MFFFFLLDEQVKRIHKFSTQNVFRKERSQCELRMLATRSARLVQSRALSDEMKLTFAAANKTFFDNAKVRQIYVPSFSGSFGILAKHVPTLAVLKPDDVPSEKMENLPNSMLQVAVSPSMKLVF